MSIVKIQTVEGPEKVRLAGGKRFTLKTGEILIGESWVDPAHRGKGLYPAMLKQMIGDKVAYVVTTPDNISAQRAFLKAGFGQVFSYRVLNILGWRIRL